MSELEDVFGEDFAQHVQEKTAERRQERNRLTEEQMAEVAHLAITEGKFEEGDPQFTYTTDNGITHNILLMEVPDPEGGEVWEHLSEPWEGAARLPLSYLGEWFWSTFPEKKDVASLEQGDHCIVAGAIEESEGDDGQIYKSIYPVRGVMTLDKAQEMASKYDGDADFEEEDSDDDFAESEEGEDTSEEESSSDESDDGLDFSSDDDGSSGGLDGLMGDEDSTDDEEEEESQEEESAPPYEDIAAKVETLADEQDPDEEPQVFEIEEGSEHHQRLSVVVANQLELDDEDAVADIVIDVIKGHRDEEEEEEEEDETNQLF